MKSNIHLMVFTDLDGTLIDHDTYRWDAAQEALSALGSAAAGVVLASSKTAAEVGALRAELGLQQWPAIVENGAGVLPPHVCDTPDNAPYIALRRALDKAPEALRHLFRGFGDATTAEVAEMTGLPLRDARLAKQRAFSEPGQWSGTDTQKAEFLIYLQNNDVTAQQGGRFLTLSFGGNKADQMRKIIAAYQPQHTIALGDAPNDVQMLKTAEFGVVIANPHRPPLPPLKGEATGHIIRTKAAGPSGWNAAILDLLKRLEPR
ncbi:HAD-IIB family hydrolase [Pseudorhodobacter turbinis]|uniref:HAD-IIB family hydrolase n=1 Tax=Pseudorhodobacter turbinis TaxID=2500533 RepID=A0A4P8EDG1_9RHOB|nr:HAD-IIB family hydrolase [Pseudorhodobacter turbinis]QCO54782.1 HAD-IIB family hydrolase [Pseudorhodobacter turbinis]